MLDNQDARTLRVQILATSGATVQRESSLLELYLRPVRSGASGWEPGEAARHLFESASDRASRQLTNDLGSNAFSRPSMSSEVLTSPPILLAGFVYYALFGEWIDTLLLLGFAAWDHKEWLLERLPVDEDLLGSSAQAALGIFLGFIVFQAVRLVVTPQDSTPWDGFGKPLLLPCRTTHHRLFPKKHGFSYSYLAVGIPVGWTGTAGGMISSDVRSESGILHWFSFRPRLAKAWYDVDAADYLERGNGQLGLRRKLDDYLKSQVRP